jgi:hypothetical protein
MITSVNAEMAMLNRVFVKSAGTGIEHWTTNFIGNRATKVLNEPQVMLIEMSENEKIIAHYHEVDQFQIFVAGSGHLAKDKSTPLTLQYADQYTAYGPIIAGPQGLSYFVFRANTDSGSVYLDRPGYREKLKPSKKRNRLSLPLTLSTEPVLKSLKTIKLEPLLDSEDCYDGIGAYILRMGSNQDFQGPDPRTTGGQYWFVVNGSISYNGEKFPLWSTVFVDSNEMPIGIASLSEGAEIILMQFSPHLA